MQWDPQLSARYFTDAAQRVVADIRDRALDRGMLSGELTEGTAGMLAILSMLRWERKVGRAALERMGVDRDGLAQELDEAIKVEGRGAGRPSSPRFELLASGQRCLVVDTNTPLRCLLDAAGHEAQALGNNWIGTEHLLLASVRLACPRLRELLHRHSVGYEAVQYAVAEVLQH